MVRALFAVLAALAVLSASADVGAQPAGEVPRIGFLHSETGPVLDRIGAAR